MPLDLSMNAHASQEASMRSTGRLPSRLVRVDLVSHSTLDLIEYKPRSNVSVLHAA